MMSSICPNELRIYAHTNISTRSSLNVLSEEMDGSVSKVLAWDLSSDPQGPSEELGLVISILRWGGQTNMDPWGFPLI